MKFTCPTCNFEKPIQPSEESRYLGKSIRCPECKSIGTVVEDKAKSTPSANESLAGKIKDSVSLIENVRLVLVLLAFLTLTPVVITGEPVLIIAYVFGAFICSIMFCAFAGFAISVLRYCEYRIRQGI